MTDRSAGLAFPPNTRRCHRLHSHLYDFTIRVAAHNILRNFPSRHRELSVIYSLDDQPTGQPAALVELLLEASRAALQIDLANLQARASSPIQGKLIGTWPGEHYRLLAGLAQIMRPAIAVEIGTWQGASALALRAGGAPSVVTYDITPWQDIPGTLLRSTDFDDGALQQHLVDLRDTEHFEQHLPQLRRADLLFFDGPKDRYFEQVVIPRTLVALSDRRRLVVLDDIRVLNMVRLWSSISAPKLDATSLGHWSGTGLFWTGA